MRSRVWIVAGVVAVLVAAGAAAYVLTREDGYCATVQEHQRELSDIAASGEPGALFDTLPAYRDLQDAAPTDLRDEWSTVVNRIEALEVALEEAGVDPADYDPETTPNELPDDQRQAVETAARDLGDVGTVEAMAGIEQQALDVCKVPLTE